MKKPAQASLLDPADDLAQVIGPDPMALFRRGKCDGLGIEYIEFHSIPEPNTGCWLWLGAVDRKNYPRTRRRDIDDQYAHRYSLSLDHGPLGDLHALHRCDNPICVNPGHLFPGTQNDNTQDMIAKGRDRHPFGEENGLAKLTEEKVREIRRSAESQGVMAARYGVTKPAIRSILKNRTWSHVQ